MDLTDIKNRYFSNNKTGYILWINNDILGKSINPITDCKNIASIVVEQLKHEKPHYVLEIIESDNCIIINATSPGYFKNSYYTYKIYTTEISQFSFHNEIELNLFEPVKKRKRQDSPLRFEVEFPDGEIIEETVEKTVEIIEGTGEIIEETVEKTPEIIDSVIIEETLESEIPTPPSTPIFQDAVFPLLSISPIFPKKKLE